MKMYPEEGRRIKGRRVILIDSKHNNVMASNVYGTHQK